MQLGVVSDCQGDREYRAWCRVGIVESVLVWFLSGRSGKHYRTVKEINLAILFGEENPGDNLKQTMMSCNNKAMRPVPQLGVSVFYTIRIRRMVFLKINNKF